MNLLFNLFGIVAQQTRQTFIQQTCKTDAVQANFLQSLLQANRETVLGQDLGLSRLSSVEDFRQQVPISRYSTYQPYVERSFQGEANVMTPDPVVYFSVSSGSTGVPKMLPITQRSRQAVARANQAAMGFVIDAAQRYQRQLGKMLFTNSAQPYGYSPNGIAYGPISVGDLRLSSAIYQQIFAYPFEILRIDDNMTRNYLGLLFALRNRHLGILSATFPVYALTFGHYLETYSESLIDDLKYGTFSHELKLEPELRHRLEKRWRSAPRRAAELSNILQSHGTLRPKDIWPNLAFIVTARGGTSNFYLDRFPQYFGDTPVFGGTYASSEATYGVHRDFGTDGVILAVNSGFYEFIPESQWDAEQPQTRLPHELNVGDRYRIVVSALNGLYRYDVGDVVEVEGFYNAAPILIFRHRYQGVLSSTSEKTTEFHLLQTMQQLQQEFSVTLENFCVTLAKNEIPPHYLVNLELAPGHALENPVQFLQRFDEILSRLHTPYGQKRPAPIPNPRLRLLAPGSFQELRQRILDQGVLESQIKLPHLTEDRTYLDGLRVEWEVQMARDR